LCIRYAQDIYIVSILYIAKDTTRRHVQQRLTPEPAMIIIIGNNRLSSFTVDDGGRYKSP